MSRDLTEQELEEYVRALAATPELWSDSVAHDRDRRFYTELVHDEHLSVWLICWMEDQDTGFHDHDVSHGAVAVIDGGVVEERLTLNGPSKQRYVAAGGAFSFGAFDIHRVLHAGDAPAVTIHAYSPPLRRQGAYLVEEDGALKRHSISYEEELRPLEQSTG